MIPGRSVRRGREALPTGDQSSESGRVMEILTPGGEFEGYFDEYEKIASHKMSDEEHRRARAELGERYGITWHDEIIPEVRARFGIGP